MKYSTKRAIAFVMSLAVLAGTAPTNFGGFIWQDTAIVAHAIEDVAFNKEVSLTLGDDLALNFYAVGINESNVAEYTVKFSGKCVEKESGFTVKNGKYCATTHIYARNINADITATLYNGTTQIGESITYSAARYLNALDEVTTDSKTKQLISASQLFGIASAEYFNGGDLGYDEALNEHLSRINKTEADLITEAGKYDFTAPDAMISLVLDSKTAIRVYIKDVPAGTEASGYTSIASTSDKANAGYPSFFEITGLTPEMLNKEHTITVNGTDYTFSGLSWASRVLSKNTSSEKNIKMSKALVAYFMAADEYASVDVTSVAIDDKSMTSLAKGKTLKLSATVDNAATNKTIVWSSSDDTVASVDNTGEVTANKKGTAIITVTATNGTEETSDDKTDSITITVSNPAAGISLNTSALTLTKGGTDNTATLTATVNPDDADDTTVTWETSDSTVATVSDGVVTGNNAGTAIITATNKSGQKAVCVVTVQNLVDLSTLTETNYVAQDGDVLTGTSKANQIISVNEGTVTLRDATINGRLSYSGDGTLTLEGTNTVTVTGTGTFVDYPAVYIAQIRKVQTAPHSLINAFLQPLLRPRASFIFLACSVR